MLHQLSLKANRGTASRIERREVNPLLKLFAFAQAHVAAAAAELREREEGQTMAEYGVVLAVITGLVVIAIGLLSGAIATALDTVRGYL